MNQRTIISGLIVLVAIIAIWRGVWGLLDIYLLPTDPSSSFILSVLLGIIILAFFGKKVFNLIF